MAIPITVMNAKIVFLGGCDCEIDSDTGLPNLDSKGRKVPCGGEFWFEPDGFLIVFRWRPSLRNRSAAQRNKWLYDRHATVDRRRQRALKPVE
jgi:hypothetical protein